MVLILAKDEKKKSTAKEKPSDKAPEDKVSSEETQAKIGTLYCSAH